MQTVQCHSLWDEDVPVFSKFLAFNTGNTKSLISVEQEIVYLKYLSKKQELMFFNKGGLQLTIYFLF